MKLLRLRYGTILVSSVFFLVYISQIWIQPVGAASTNVTLRPISTVSNTQWTGQGTADSTCSGVCDYIDEASTDGDTSYLNGAAGQAPTATFAIGGGSTSGQTATSIEVHAVGRAGANGGLGYRPLDVTITIGGVTQPTQSVTWNTQVYQDSAFTFTGSWSKSDVDNATVRISKTANGLQPAIRVSTLYAQVTYESPVHAQSASRLYANANATSPGAPLGATNAAVETSKDVAFRLRLGLTPSDVAWEAGSWGAHANLYKLQYAQLTAASCSVQVTGWNDVASAAGAIRWYDNGSVANDAPIASIGSDDPTTSGSKVYQTYRELNGFSNTSTIPVGDTGIWDFSLVSSGQPAGLSFCFRVVKNDNTQLNAYSTYPQITLTGDLGVEIVDAAGTIVTSPTVLFSSTPTTTLQCNSTTATLGTASQRIRVSNALATNGWNVSIAATSGPTSLWSAGSSYYDFNDPAGSPPGCSDGGDGDTWAGRLTINPSVATVAPSSGCTNTGVSKGSSAAFAEGTINAITLLSADATSQRFCYWDVTGASLSQQIPSQTQPGAYALDMTITVTAQ